MSAEAKVGLFFLIALVLVGTIALYLGDFWVRARSYPVTAYFENVQGLPSGAEVRFAGVRVGRVTSVNLESSANHPGLPAAVKMAVFHDTVLYKDDEFIVQQSALLGDKYVEVKRVAVKPRDRLVAGSEVEGGKTIGIESMTEEARGLIKEARSTLVAVRGVLVSQYNEDAIHTILANVMGATGKANELATQALRLTSVLAQNAAAAGPNAVKMVANLKDASISVKNSAQLVRALLATSPVPHDMAVVSGNMRKTTGDLAEISEAMAAVIASPDGRAQMQSAMDNLHKSTANLATLTGQAAKLFDDDTSKDIRDTLTRLREAATNVSNITTTYDKLLTDPAFTADFRGTVTAARAAAESGSRAIQKAESSLDRVDQTMARVTKVTQTFNPEDVRASVSLEGSRPGGLRADLKADLQYGPKRNNFWRVGVRDVGDAETLILQRSVPVGSDRIRAGIYGNKAGIGYDVTPDARTSVEVDLWNPNDPRLDLRGSYGLTEHIDGLLGFNDVGSETAPFVGVRYHSNPGR